MSREAHVQFWESAEVKSLRATRLMARRNPESMLGWAPLDVDVLADVAPLDAVFAEYVAVLSLLHDKAGRRAFFPLPSLLGSVAPGSSGIRNEPEFERSPVFAGAERSSAPACSHSGRSTPVSAPHGMHAARSR